MNEAEPQAGGGGCWLGSLTRAQALGTRQGLVVAWLRLGSGGPAVGRGTIGAGEYAGPGQARRERVESPGHGSRWY